MTARIISGKEVASRIHAEVSAGVEEYREKYDGVPGLSVVLIGDDPASHSYVKGKELACEMVGIKTETIRRDASTTQAELLGIVEGLNRDPQVHGILVQLPLPKHLDESTVIHAIDPMKDVDGLHPENAGLLLLGRPRFAPATPLGVQRMLVEENVNMNGARVVIVGRSKLVGMPLAALLLQKGPGANSTVTVCHTGTKDIAAETKRADVLIAAAGFPGTVTVDMVKPGAVVIDVGVSRVDDPSRKRGYRLTGDVDFESVSEVASAITPVPGGVGPMTIAMLLVNVLRAANLAATNQDHNRKTDEIPLE
ncbi:MAG: bifunctional 5,10-methylenetetrahydrofolate dehydrogenase/5,10-methenyltetrahydrofolate cyclohydrolase [Chloroflexi bacterium]|nr:bifunctional 5,10-methylenetetrahydrofolate dehydrogenase/5,10-methenyltetrahydrofolate cyclohydrolase [Chloroflexota bacterium]